MNDTEIIRLLYIALRRLDELEGEVGLVQQTCNQIQLQVRHLHECCCPKPKSATLTIISGDVEMGAFSIPVNGTAFGLFQEWSGPNGTGQVVPPAGPVNYASDTPAVAAVDSSGNITGVSPGTANISGTDSVNGLTASAPVEVVAVVPPAQSATMTIEATPTTASATSAVNAAVKKLK